MPPGTVRRSLCDDELSSPKDSTSVRVYPISPKARNDSEYAGGSEPIMGIDETGRTPASVPENACDAPVAPKSGCTPAPDQGEEEEVEEGRVPRTRKAPGSLSPEELRHHSLTHIPYHPGCKCCVAGRKRDHKHPRRERGPLQKQADMEDANGSSISAD